MNSARGRKKNDDQRNHVTKKFFFRKIVYSNYILNTILKRIRKLLFFPRVLSSVFFPVIHFLMRLLDAIL